MASSGCKSEAEPRCASGELTTPMEDDDSGDTGELGSVDVEGEACLMPVPSAFTSVDELEMATGPDGATMGHWRVSFEEDSFEWTYSDVVVQGRYRCNGSEVAAVEPAVIGVFDEAESTLLWDDRLYRKLD